MSDVRRLHEPNLLAPMRTHQWPTDSSDEAKIW